MAQASRAARGLTPRQAIFVRAYTAGPLGVRGNGRRAALQAGVPDVSATVMASRWLTKANVAQAIAQGFEKYELTADSVRREIAAIAHSQLRRVAPWSESGGLALVDSADLDDRDAASIEAITEERHERIEPGAPGRPEVRHVDRRFKVKLHDKVAALSLAAKVLGLVRERHEHSGPDGGPIPVDARVVFYLPQKDSVTTAPSMGPIRALPAILALPVKRNGSARNGTPP